MAVTSIGLLCYHLVGQGLEMTSGGLHVVVPMRSGEGRWKSLFKVKEVKEWGHEGVSVHYSI